MNQAEKLFEMALNSKRCDKMLNNRDVMVDSLNDYMRSEKLRYENLLNIEREKGILNAEQLTISDKIIGTYKDQLRIQTKRTRWANIKFYTALAGLIVVAYLGFN